MAYTRTHKRRKMYGQCMRKIFGRRTTKNTHEKWNRKKKSPAPDENWKTMMAMTITNEKKFTGHQRQKYQESKTFDLITLSRKIHLFCAFVRINLFIWKDGRSSFCSRCWILTGPKTNEKQTTHTLVHLSSIHVTQ